MGAWGPAIFSDDTACDIRNCYKEEVANGIEGQEATRFVLAKFDMLLKDPDEGPVVWLALAATQWKLGRLENEIKTKALEIIDLGFGLDIWKEDKKLLEKRKIALQKLKDQLVSPQPSPKKIKKPFCPPIYLDLQAGDAISYQMQSGNYVIFRCVKNILDRMYGAFPTFDILDWTDTSIPNAKEISHIHYAKERTLCRVNVFAIYALRKKDFPSERVHIVTRGLHFKQPDINSNTSWGMMWNTIDEDIEKHFRLTPAGTNWSSRIFRR